MEAFISYPLFFFWLAIFLGGPHAYFYLQGLSHRNKSLVSSPDQILEVPNLSSTPLDLQSCRSVARNAREQALFALNSIESEYHRKNFRSPEEGWWYGATIILALTLSTGPGILGPAFCGMCYAYTLHQRLGLFFKTNATWRCRTAMEPWRRLLSDRGVKQLYVMERDYDSIFDPESCNSKNQISPFGCGTDFLLFNTEIGGSYVDVEDDSHWTDTGAPIWQDR